MDIGEFAVLVLPVAILPLLKTLSCALAERVSAHKLIDNTNLFIFVPCFIIITLSDLLVRI